MKRSPELLDIEARWRLGLVPMEEIPRWATEQLSSESVSPTLLQLALCDRDDDREIGRLFRELLEESGGGEMSPTDALRFYARKVSRAILARDTGPKEGAESIWRATLVVGEPDFHELDAFIYAASEMSDRPTDRQLFADAIFAEAARWARSDLDNPRS
ncbi:hypothetical protein [Ramlibacter sp.]|uniref:hypothetical protein n=1 Tax=Ramlibacter sp. TaxID=1917967 RepID=UPI003D0F0072